MQLVQEVVVSIAGKPVLWLSSVICLTSRLVSCVYLCYAIYAITLHPLASYKGPILWTTTRILHTYHVLKGTLPFKTAELHKKYGAIVRIGPNELSYIREDAWKDIWGHKPGGAELIKDGTTFAPPPGTAYGILTTPSTKDHARMRRNLNHGFSDKALRDQEPGIVKYVGLLIERLRDHSKDGPVDISTWYNFMTFDIIGELAFGRMILQTRSHVFKDDIVGDSSYDVHSWELEDRTHMWTEGRSCLPDENLVATEQISTAAVFLLGNGRYKGATPAVMTASF